jgi:hypothetical protein
MSSVPRLEDAKGFSWAPRTPNVQSPNLESLLNAYASDGSGSEVGIITAEGLEAIWLIYQVKPGEHGRFSDSRSYSPTESSEEIDNIQPAELVMNKCWIKARELQKSHPRVCLLMPKSQSAGRYFGPESSKNQDPLVAIAFSDSELPRASNTYEDEWTWSGVDEWPSRIPLPEMDWEKILLM